MGRGGIDRRDAEHAPLPPVRRRRTSLDAVDPHLRQVLASELGVRHALVPHHDVVRKANHQREGARASEQVARVLRRVLLRAVEQHPRLELVSKPPFQAFAHHAGWVREHRHRARCHGDVALRSLERRRNPVRCVERKERTVASSSSLSIPRTGCNPQATLLGTHRTQPWTPSGHATGKRSTGYGGTAAAARTMRRRRKYAMEQNNAACTRSSQRSRRSGFLIHAAGRRRSKLSKRKARRWGVRTGERGGWGPCPLRSRTEEERPAQETRKHAEDDAHHVAPLARHDDHGQGDELLSNAEKGVGGGGG